MTECGVTGDALIGPIQIAFGPCDQPATEEVRFLCERGHERTRQVCPAHADTLTRPRGDEATFCATCQAEGYLSPLVPLVPPADRPPAPYHWRGEE